jgi:hypothetical protein
VAVGDAKGTRQPSDDRRKRLAEQLRTNLQRRKTQARSRRDGSEDRRPEGIAAAEGRETGKD